MIRTTLKSVGGRWQRQFVGTDSVAEHDVVTPISIKIIIAIVAHDEIIPKITMDQIVLIRLNTRSRLERHGYIPTWNSWMGKVTGNEKQIDKLQGRIKRSKNHGSRWSVHLGKHINKKITNEIFQSLITYGEASHDEVVAITTEHLVAEI